MAKPNSGESKATLPTGIKIAYETFGKVSSEPLLLIHGLSWQMIMWDREFCELLAGRGYFVIRFDNRDVGQSTVLDDTGIPDIIGLLTSIARGEPVSVPYLLTDMAGDVFGLLDHLGIESAHVMGMSMGGMIGQTMALEKPERIRSLTSLSSTTGDPSLPPPTQEALAVITIPPPAERSAFVSHFLATWRTLNGSRFPVDEERVTEYARQSFDRGFSTGGVARQIAAINASGSRRTSLRSLVTPLLVIHGDADPLLPVQCGIDTAEAVAGSKLNIIEGMGHTLPAQVWRDIVDAVAAHAK
ncbi:MAG TPA: alpha/beta hydrolase [Deltaproteobacteria bacterium]|nr:alpha/beta hydrolase [Deltaproteobacteria bacterium]